MKLHIENLAIEITRRCNMCCAHCMRGPAQNMDLDLKKFDAFLDHVEYIDDIVFTGGEPTLNVSAIRHILTQCKRKRIQINSFFTVTNGKKIPKSFYHVMLDWYQYCLLYGNDPEICTLALSKDQFHEPISPTTVLMLKGLSFFSKKDKKIDWTKHSLHNIGNARQLNDPYQKRNLEYFPPNVEIHNNIIHVRDCNLAFTCDGDILMDCDYEYTSANKLKLCDYTNVESEFYHMATDPNYKFPTKF